MKYKGIVRDRLKELETRETRQYETYLEAHKAAERLCNKHFTGDRGEVDVITREANKASSR